MPQNRTRRAEALTRGLPAGLPWQGIRPAPYSVIGQPGKAAPHWFLAALCLLLSACSPAPSPSPAAHTDETKAHWYSQTVQQLAKQNQRAQALIKGGKQDDAAALIQSGEQLSSRLLAVPRPTLGAMEGAGDVDRLYGRMLLSNRNYGWARLFFQKNLVRWKNWKPQTPDTAARLKQAEADIADCDRQLQ